MLHINEIKLTGEDNWTKKFNLCSELFQKANDESLTEEERNAAWKEYIEYKQRLEMGIPTT